MKLLRQLVCVAGCMLIALAALYIVLGAAMANCAGGPCFSRAQGQAILVGVPLLALVLIGLILWFGYREKRH